MTTPMTALPANTLTNPRLSQWIGFGGQRRITVYSGKVELGQGIGTALGQIACDGLGVTPEQLTMVAGHTARSPNEQYTAGSQSIENGGAALLCACLEARYIFMQAASLALNVPVTSLRVQAGVFSSTHTDHSTDYWQLLPAVDLDILIQGRSPAGEQGLENHGDATTGQSALAPEPYIGARLNRTDLAAKLSGGAFIHDKVLAGMVHARILRAADPRSELASIDLTALRALPGITDVVRSGSFVAILGEDEAGLVRALPQARGLVQWVASARMGTQSEVEDALLAAPYLTTVPHRVGEPVAATLAHQARYSRPYLAHASIGPACALAEIVDGHLTVWSHTQGPHMLRDQIAQALGRDKLTVDVAHMSGAGCYGHNGADDVAFDAALIATLSARSVRVQWMREDELTSSPFGAASLVQIDAGVDAAGKVCAWTTQVWSPTHIKRPGWGEGVNLLGAWASDLSATEPPDRDVPLPAGGGLRNAIPIYDFPHQQVTHHFIEKTPLRVSALRSLGAYANIFAIESLMDELAEKIGVDPVAFRLSHLSDPRARVLIARVAGMADWYARQALPAGVALGLGFGRYKNYGAYCATIARVRVEEKIHVEKVWVAVDAGRIINPDGLANQIEGGIIQSLSWTLKEQVTWDASGITSCDWDTYPILMFDEIPDVELSATDYPELPSLGAGEAAAGPTAAAVANAVTAAMGIRPRHLPLTPERMTRLIMAS